MTFPQMKSGSGTVLGLYRLGRYSSLLIRDPESVGPIKYLFVLIITEQGSKTPVLAVTCERNEMQGELLGAIAATLDEQTRRMLASAPQTFLCLFDKDGAHHNLGSTQSDIDADGFRAKAFSVAREKLGVTDQPVPVNPSTSPASPSETSPRSAKAKWVVALTIAALIVVVLFPPYTEHFVTSRFGEISGHGGWQFIFDIGRSNTRTQTESINVGLWLLELIVAAATGGVLWFLLGRK